MKRIVLLCSLLLFAAFLITCKQSAQADDPEKLKAVLFGYFDGISTHNYQKLNDLTTPDFILYESGKVWNNDSLIKSVNRFPKAIITYKFDNLKINVDQSSGNINYYNHGEFTLNDTTHRSVDWVESATFKKVNGEWKMDFLHSTTRK